MAPSEKVTTFKIYVGNLEEGTTSEEIRKIFEEYGTVVECDTVRNRAFVHMEDDIEGKHAVEQLQLLERELNGKKLSVEESKSQLLPKIPTVKLLVKNISTAVDARGLRNMFKKFGYVIEAEISNGEGHVCLEATGDIGSAIKEMNGFIVEDMALTVEPAPSIPVPQASSAPTLVPSPKKKTKSPIKNNGRGPSWSNPTHRPPRPGPYQPDMYENDYTNDYYELSGPGSYDYNSPRPPMHLPRPSFQGQPERILRDPHSHPRNHFPQRFPNAPRPRFPGPGPSHMGPRGPPRRLIPPAGPHRLPYRVPQPGMHNRVPIHRGARPPPPCFDPNVTFENPFYQREEAIPRNPLDFVEEFYQEEEEVFYEDEPLPDVPSYTQVPRYNNMAGPSHGMGLSGANSVPVGSGNRGSYSVPNPQFQRPGPLSQPGRGRGGIIKRGGMSGRGRGWARPQRFTAVTSEIAPGEKYPVPPMHNPSFRAPMKWPKEEVKRKLKKKKKPLVPAELPDYSVPVPEIPRPTIPKGAVLKPFPAPLSTRSSEQELGADTMYPHQFGNAGAMFFQQHGNQNYIDFTSDDYGTA